MSEESAGEKTENPSGKRLRDAREQGNVPRSADSVAAVSLLAVTTALAQTGGAGFARLQAHLAE